MRRTAREYLTRQRHVPRVQTSPSSLLQSGVEFVFVSPTFQLGRIAGIRVGVNWSWLVVSQAVDLS